MKKTERARAKEILSHLAESELNRLGEKVSKNIIRLLSKIISKNLLLMSHQCIGAYVPIQAEVRWPSHFTEETELKFAVPHLDDDNSMSYYQVSRKQILEGKVGLKLSQPNKILLEKPQVLLIPGLAFTKDGKRLGRGKGYFDRYLANFEGVKIGVGYECQLFKELTQDEFDIKMDYVITEKKIYKGKNK